MILLAADVFRRVPKLESLPRTFAHYSPVRNNYIEMMLYHEKGLGPRDASPSHIYPAGEGLQKTKRVQFSTLLAANRRSVRVKSPAKRDASQWQGLETSRGVI